MGYNPPKDACPQCGEFKCRRAKLCMACSSKINIPRHNWPPAEERFWSRVVKSDDPDGCWLWTGSHNADGYGHLMVNGHLMQAHQFSYELVNGPLPEGKEACHSCDTPNCVRPDHIWAGTHLQNIRDAKKKGRIPSGDNSVFRRFPNLHCNKKGEEASCAKLTWAQVNDIRRLHSEGVTMYRLHKTFGMSRYAIWAIIHNKTWVIESPLSADTQQA